MDKELPKATISKIIQDNLQDQQCSVEARDFISDCCTEFIHLLTLEANTILNQSQRKVITPQHILDALDKLGFSEFRDDLEEILKSHQTESKSKNEKRKGGSIAGVAQSQGMTVQEMAEQQQQLFANARQKYEQLLMNAGQDKQQ